MKTFFFTIALLMGVNVFCSGQAENVIYTTGEYGDAPEGATAYPASGVIGTFPTCAGLGPANYIIHTSTANNLRFGAARDMEPEGNAGLCPAFVNQYNQDECYGGDAGLSIPGSYTITGPAGNQVVQPCPQSPSTFLGYTCGPMVFGTHIDINVTNNTNGIAFVNLLIDWNQDGSWGGVFACPNATPANNTEWVLMNWPVPPGFSGLLSTLIGPNNVWTIGPNSGYVWARFTIIDYPLNVQIPWNGQGIFEGGETEDYLLSIQAVDYGDAPDPSYPTLAINNGAGYVIQPGIRMGASIDGDFDGQPDMNATGDDLLGIPDDEDGVTVNWGLTLGSPTNLTVNTSVSGYINAWADFNLDGDWTDAQEQIFHNAPVNAGNNSLNYIVPWNATLSKTFLRFRFCQTSGHSITGIATVPGEVEDYNATFQTPLTNEIWKQPVSTALPGIECHDTIIPGAGYQWTEVSDDFEVNTGIVNPGMSDVHWYGAYQAAGSGIKHFRITIYTDAQTPNCPQPGPAVATYNALLASCNQTATPLMNSNNLTIYAYDYFLPSFLSLNQGPRYRISITAISNDSTNPVIWRWQEAARSVWTAGCPARISKFLLGNSGGWPLVTWPGNNYSDMAFTITTTPLFDYGDAPDPTYPTLLASGGAQHSILQGFHLGGTVDGETNGQPNATASGDNTNGVPDDEDGVSLNWTLNPGSPTSILVTTPATGFLDAWSDFNGDGDWADAGEKIFHAVPLIPGGNVMNYIIPLNATTTPTFMRYRLSQQGGLAFSGPGGPGEVEDYQITYTAMPGIKWIQPPHPQYSGIHTHDAVVAQSLQNIVGADDWLCQGGSVTDIHWYGAIENQGSGILHFHLSIHNNDPSGNCLPADPEIWGVNVSLASTNPTATGILNSSGEMIYEYSYILTTPFQQVTGNRYWLDITSTSVNPANPCLWKWAEAARSNVPVLCGAVTKSITAGVSGPWSTLLWQNQLKTDFAFKITSTQPPTFIDFGDAPDPTYPTLSQMLGAGHFIDNVHYLGTTVDAEADGQPNATATGDDNNGTPDDEDGMIVLWPAYQGNPFVINVTTNGANGLLQTFIDFNGDGDWWDPGEHLPYLTNFPLPAGSYKLPILIPPNATLGNTFMRLRFSTQAVTSAGWAQDGEVEDYMINIQNLPGIKWHQPVEATLPGHHDHDYSSAGVNYQTSIADDWLCYGGAVTDIHWYGNYEKDANGNEKRGSGVNHFEIGFYNDNGYFISTPIPPVLWSHSPTFAQVSETPTGIYNNEGCMIYKYTLYLDTPFMQQANTRYWMELYAVSNNNTNPAIWRWQEALRSVQTVLAPAQTRLFTNNALGPWYTLPNTSQLGSDMAFDMTSTLDTLDYGDAPDPMYPTLLGSNGARHANSPPGVFMGNLKDKELNGNPSTDAQGDDNNNLDDEDGVTIPLTMNLFQTYTCNIYTNYAGAFFTGWIDYNGDGDWADAGEKIISDQTTVVGNNAFTFTIPASAVVVTTYARFRICTNQGLSYNGLAPNGEVEDYKVVINPPSFDFGDAPDPTYPTHFASNGARHGNGAPNLFMGQLKDFEGFAQSNADATGDNINNLNDEDGVSFNTAVVPGQMASITITANDSGGIFNGWIDFNADGDWKDAGEHIIVNSLSNAGVNLFNIPVPANASLSATFARFRFASVSTSDTGYAANGEVEDYKLFIVNPGTGKIHWPQLPDLNPNATGVGVDLSWTPLADDFLCTSSGPIRHIRLWNSFASDILPLPNVGSDTIILSICADIPAGPNNTFSKPGTILWTKTFAPGQYTYKLVTSNVPAWWYDPATQVWQVNNHFLTYRLDFGIDTNYFWQSVNTVYWLKVDYVHPPIAVNGTLGWKTTQPALRWNDAGVWLNPNNPNFPAGWVPLSYPPGHPLSGQPMDLAFTINNSMPGSMIAGKVTYDNVASTPLLQSKIFLKQGAVVLDSIPTDNSGDFAFYDLSNGVYTLSGISSLPWSGANSGDALLIQKHFVGLSMLQGLRAKAADVNASVSVNTLDAMMVARRFTGILSSFPAGNWIFEKPTVNINAFGAYLQNMKALCFGDVNGSHIPTTKQQPAVKIAMAGSVEANPDGSYTIPLKSLNSIDAGSISLTLAYPSGWQIRDLSCVKQNKGDMSWKAENGILRIAWYSTESWIITEGDILFTIRIVANGANPNTFGLTIGGESEFTDPAGVRLPTVEMVGPGITETAGFMKFRLEQNLPNPVREYTEFSYVLPKTSVVSIHLYNAVGVLVMTLSDEQFRFAGRYTVQLSTADLPEGIYIYKLKANHSNGIFEASKRMIIIR